MRHLFKMSLTASLQFFEKGAGFMGFFTSRESVENPVDNGDKGQI